MPDFVLALGPIGFYDTEVPQELQATIKQSIVVHKYPGGIRTLDAMGPDYDPIQWSGVFFGELAESRWNMLETVAKQGVPVALTWSSFQKTVLIETAKIRYRRFWHIDYEITCQVVSNDSLPDPQDDTPDIDGQIQSDKGFAGNLADKLRSIGSDIKQTLQPVTDVIHQGEQAVGNVLNDASAVLGGAMDGLNTAFSGIPSFVTAPLTSLVPALGNVTTTLGAANGMLAAAGQSLTQTGNPANFAVGVGPLAMAQSLQGLSASAQSSAMAFAFSGGVSRIGQNLGSLIRGY